MVILILRVPVVNVVVNAVGAPKFVEHIKTLMRIVEAVMMVIQLWNIAKGVRIL